MAQPMAPLEGRAYLGRPLALPSDGPERHPPGDRNQEAARGPEVVLRSGADSSVLQSLLDHHHPGGGDHPGEGQQSVLELFDRIAGVAQKAGGAVSAWVTIISLGT